MKPVKVYNYAKTVRQGMRLLFRAINLQIRDQWFVQFLPPVKPIVIQFPVNDICNSRCIMCNIWQRKRDKEITPEELRRILADPLFNEICYVGMNGGEPTLRPDLHEIGQVLIESLPKLKGIGIITNALRPSMVIERVLALAQVARNNNISFGVGVSLDGIGEDHDQNRGMKGNFISAVEVINTLRHNGISVSIGCTLTPLNCYGADDVLSWCEQNNIQNWEFRLGVEIKRIYNTGYSQQYPFTQEQRFHLIMFFDKLANCKNVGMDHSRFYRSLVDQLAFGLPRQAGCDWRSSGVTLDARGNISYCSVQSPILGSALEKSAWQIYQEGLPERKRIIQKYCDNCQHDLLGPPPARIMAREAIFMMLNPWRRYWNKFRKKSDSFLYPFRVPKPILPANNSFPSEWKHVLITGWYGTETAGDKAILGELLHFLKIYTPSCRITLTTLDHKVSQQTKLEMPELGDVNIINMNDGNNPALIESVDAVIIGGGPLEEIEQTEYIWRMFVEANRQRKARVIFGCGVGPLYSDHIKQMVSAICQMATSGFLRDEESREYAIKLGGSESLGCACDPALAYIQRWVSNTQVLSEDKQPHIVGLLRANTREYIVDMNDTELNEFNNQTACQISKIFEPICMNYKAKVDLLAMHEIWIGGDDRLFNRQVADIFNNPDILHIERRYLTLDMLLRSINLADAALVMRYHGHLFCMALGIPFISIDYTGESGKVNSLINRIGYQQWSEDWHNINVSRAASRLQDLYKERLAWSMYLRQQTNNLVSLLTETYTKVFGVPKL